MEVRCGDLRVAAEARVDNRRDLLHTLGLAHRAGEIGDTERQYAELDQLENLLPPAPERRPTIVLNFHT